ARPVVRRLEEAETQVLRRELDAEEIARDPAGRREKDNAGRVRVLLLLLVPGVAEADGLGKPPDRLGVSREEAPAGRRTRPAVEIEHLNLLDPGLRRRFLRVEADGD